MSCMLLCRPNRERTVRLVPSQSSANRSVSTGSEQEYMLILGEWEKDWCFLRGNQKTAEEKLYIQEGVVYI